MNNLEDYKNLIEARLDLKGFLKIEGDKIIPNRAVLKDKKTIVKYLVDDLFEFHFNKLVFKARFMNFVGEITDRKIKTGHYFLSF